MTNELIPSTSVITPLIEMFKVAPSCVTCMSEMRKRALFSEALSKGYLIDPKCLNEYVGEFIESIDMQYNSTFYKAWNDVTDKSRSVLLFDQILHYLTTYGTDFSLEGTGYEYIPNTNPEEPAWNTYKVITAVDFKELYQRCMNMLASGIALKSETVRDLTNYIIVYAKEPDNACTPNVDMIKNREALVILCDALGVLPMDGAKLFAHIVYKATGETMIIKNRDMRKRIAASKNSLGHRDTSAIWRSLNDAQLMRLAEVFNRYKDLFLAFKAPNTAGIINKISRLSKKYHKPMKRGYWETILHSRSSLNFAELQEEAKKATNFKLLQVMQSIRERLLLAAGQGDNMYIIRNGKIFIKDNEYSAIDSRYFSWEDIYKVCEAQIIENLSKKACKVKLPQQYVLACPTSEKNFIGDVPMGTYCQLGKDSIMGIYWKNEWGTRDFDLSFNTVTGSRIGWNSGYYSEDQNVIYSGDITNAPNGANELLYFRGTDIPTGLVNVNRYNGQAGSKYKIFFGTMPRKTFDSINKNGELMIDPNKVQLEAMITQSDAAEQMVGMILDGTFFFYSLSTGYGKVTNALVRRGQQKNSSTAWTNAASEMTDILIRKANAMVPMKDLLLKAGFVETTVDEEVELNLTELDRSTLIDLFS